LEKARQSLHDLPDLSQYILGLQDLAANALAPLRRFLEMIEVLSALVECFNALIDALLPPSPGPIITCVKALIEAFARLLLFIPPLSYIPTVLDLTVYTISVIDEVVGLFELLDQRLNEYKNVLTSALELGDLELAAITDCASGEARVLTVNLMEILKFITPLIQAIVTPIARLVPSPPLRTALKQVADIPTTLSAIQTGIEDTSGPPVLSPLLETMFILRNILVVMHNIVAPVIGDPANQVPKEVPTFDNF
jgi:hypothetical protein